MSKPAQMNNETPPARMKIYTITQEQLLALEAAVWGARFTSETDLENYQRIVREIKKTEALEPQ
jgi:hypothetical protein